MRYFARSGWAHLLLLTGTAIFLFPFLWMIITSVKTDEEVQEGRWWPEIPRFRESSPDDRPIELLGLQVRALDASIHNIDAHWKVTTGDARLEPRSDRTLLRYHFPTPDAAPITLQADFDFPIDPDQLHKLILTVKPDDSWHALSLTLDAGGTRFVSTRPMHLAQTRVIGQLFQPPSFDDTTLAAKTWIPLREISSLNSKLQAPNKSKIPNRKSQIANRKSQLTLTLAPSSTLSATVAKFTRNYWRAFHAVPFWRYLLNSLLLVALTTIGVLFSSSFVAYAFARLHWPGRSLALIVLLSTMMLPAQVTFIPQFLIWRTFGWYNTLNPLWAPAFCGGAFFIFLMTQTMKTLPRELEESARIDGLGAVQTWYYIILPQVKPTAAAIAVMTFMWSWNEFLGPLIYLRDQSKFPLSLGLFAMRLENFGDWSLIMAANVLMTLPVIVLFFLCQRYFIQGMTMSGMK